MFLFEVAKCIVSPATRRSGLEPLQSTPVPVSYTKYVTKHMSKIEMGEGCTARRITRSVLCNINSTNAQCLPTCPCPWFTVLKLVGTPHAMLVERFQIMWPDGGASDLQVSGFILWRKPAKSLFLLGFQLCGEGPTQETCSCYTCGTPYSCRALDTLQLNAFSCP